MEGEKTKYVSHMVGIIPIQNGPKNDGYPWPSALIPLYKHYTALHQSVLECAMAGCTSIWVIAEKKHIPLMKALVGTYVEDPVLAQLPVEFKENFSMRIPIWYAPVPARDLKRRGCYSFSILAGADYAVKLSSRISLRVIPKKFYVSFPHMVYSPWTIQKSRKDIKSTSKNFYLENANGTYKNGIGMGFTFFLEDYRRIKADFKTMDKGDWEGTSLDNLKRRPIEERKSALKLGLDEVFRCATLDGASTKFVINTHDVSTWEGYVKYISAGHFYKMPKKVKYFRYDKMKNIEERPIETGDYDDTDSEN